MLTKDLVRYKSKAGKITPGFLDPKDSQILALSKALIRLFTEGLQKTAKAIDDAAEEIVYQDPIIKRGLQKLLEDRSEWQNPDSETPEKRYEILLQADALRQENIFESYMEFRKSLEETLKKPFKEIYETVYGDLIELRQLSAFSEITPEDLIHRYNAALVQALLLRAKKLVVEIERCDLIEKRAIFRQLKFHKILVEIKKDEDERLHFDLSGPLSLFDSAQTYGLRMANFFPHLLHLRRFSLEACIESDKKGDLKLCLDEGCGIKSHYASLSGYVPEEFSACLEAFNAEQREWKAKASGDFVALGRESYSFADFTIEGEKTVYVELFHRWHKKQILDRIKVLMRFPRQDLILGCDRHIAKDPELKLLIESDLFKKQGFLFRDFPTVKQLTTVLSRE